ncbi:unnamed protein product [Meloidogyne enterolobii]|uniref:Uncharacterized protein n=1 Tax=Meloidogyne enterolobii TaxID=390850 RepID=A0ACB0ZBD8_MELEN
MGGHRSVTKENKWSKVLKKLKLDLSKGDVDALQVKKTYMRYFEKFESFMNKLGNSSLIVAAASSTSTSQRNTRIVRTIATPSQSSGDKQSKRSRGGKSSSTRGGSSAGTLSRSRSTSTAKDHSPAFSVCTKSSAKSSKKSSEEPLELQPLHFSFSSSTTSSSTSHQHFESPTNQHKRTMSFNIGSEKFKTKFNKKSSPLIKQKIASEEKIVGSTNSCAVIRQHFDADGKLKKPSLFHQTNKIKPSKSHESITSTKPNSPTTSETLKRSLSSFVTSTSIPATSGGNSKFFIKKSSTEGNACEGL